MLKGKTVLLGVTGGIAAYKAAYLASALVKLHAQVDVVMTENATKFIAPLTFEHLTARKAYTDTFDRFTVNEVEHIALADRADLVIVAPATANICAKIAHGIGDDMLSTTLLACRCPRLIAPAMNTNMLENPATQDNLKQLEKYPEITPVCLKRTTDYHSDDLEGEFASAKAIRQALKEGKDVSAYTPMAEQLSAFPHIELSQFYPLIRSRLLTSSPQQLRDIFLVDEGIENLMIKNAYNCYDFDSFMDSCITRRYTRSRIQRTICQILVNNQKESMKKLPAYDIVRVLGFTEAGRQYLKHLQQQGIRMANHYTANIKPYRDLEYRAAVIYGSLFDQSHQEYINRSEISGLNL